MRFFLRTKKFKIAVTVIAIVTVCGIIALLMSSGLSLGSNILSSVTEPIGSFFTDLSRNISAFADNLTANEKLAEKNAELERTVAEYRKNEADYEEAIQQNEFYKNYLNIKDTHKDFVFCDAKVITRDPDDDFCNFTINRGTVDGVSEYDPVIIDSYLVGYVTSAGLSTSKVTTLLDPALIAGAVSSRTSDPGLVSGDRELARQGMTKLYNLSSSCLIAVGDYIVTSGEGVFPEGLLIGTVENIKTDSVYSSLYALITPFADFTELKNVMVITDFDGKGSLGSERLR